MGCLCGGGGGGGGGGAHACVLVCVRARVCVCLCVDLWNERQVHQAEYAPTKQGRTPRWATRGEGWLPHSLLRPYRCACQHGYAQTQRLNVRALRGGACVGPSLPAGAARRLACLPTAVLYGSGSRRAHRRRSSRLPRPGGSLRAEGLICFCLGTAWASWRPTAVSCSSSSISVGFLVDPQITHA